MRYISRANEAPTIPIVGTAVWVLVLDRLNAPMWVWGAVGSVLAMVLVATVVSVAKAEYVDVLKDRK